MTDSEATAASGPVHDESDEDASEAQAQIIASLRAQVTDLFSQVTQLNGKLVASYDRMSNLEDQLHDASSSLRNASVTISSLELERSHHLDALNTGLLVEKAHVTAELTRLMERATEEAAQRGQAESARHDIEKDLDDLSATLFDQANTMVAEARFGKAQSERKVYEAEQALKIAEDAVKDMQVQMQSLQAEKEAAERDTQEARLTVRKGKWVERDDSHIGEVPRIRFMTTHSPYAEFITFIAHLRALRVSLSAPPVISTLLNQPFVARLLAEDSEPTVRLDLAPSLNWLSRRSVLAAIHTGMLTVEPLPFSSLVHEMHQHPPSTSNSSLTCALCGTLIARLPPSTPVSRSQNTNGGSWFKYPLSLTSQNHSSGMLHSPEREPPEQVYIFRLATPIASSPPPFVTSAHTSSVSMSVVGASTRPPLNAISPSRVLQPQTQNSPYPLCTSNYCLTRLRSTCSLWAFVRVGIVERVWDEEVQILRPRVNGGPQETPSSLTTASATNNPINDRALSSASEKPPVPPRRRRLWEMASALGERAASWGKESGENTKEKGKETDKDSVRKLPSPPPFHPSVPHPYPESPTSQVNLRDPPPLPKRSIIRSGATSDTVVPETEVATTLNGHTDPDEDHKSLDPLESPADEITFAAPVSEPSPPPSATSHPVAAEVSAPSIPDQPPPPSPRAVPLPITPTIPTAPVSRVTSPAPRPRSRVSSPASPPPSSRPASPAIMRSHAGSPPPSSIARTSSPSAGHAPSASLIRGKTSMPSPLASSRPVSPALATGPGAPPLPRRAAARRVAPPPPTSAPKVAEGGCKEEGASPVTTAIATTVVDSTPEPDAPKAREVESPAETRGRDGEGQEAASASASVDVKEAIVNNAQAVSGTSTTEADPGLGKDDGVGDVNGVHGDVDGTMNEVSASIVPDPLLPRVPEGDGRKSVDTASTKRSSSTEGEGFASDATWEERTWKEIVRLKEDMFWARIGGVRAPRG